MAESVNGGGDGCSEVVVGVCFVGSAMDGDDDDVQVEVWMLSRAVGVGPMCACSLLIECSSRLGVCRKSCVSSIPIYLSLSKLSKYTGSG